MQSALRRPLARALPALSAALRATLLQVVLLAAMCGSAAAQECPYTPAVGSAERKAIMDTLRAPVEVQLKQRVVFVVEKFTACRSWAFLEATLQRPDGRPLDWTITPFNDAVAEDMCGGYIHALLVLQDGRWEVSESVICASDVPWVSWAEQYGAPPELFPRLN